MWVKICGTTTLADAQLAIEHGADALGFIFAPSKRRVTVEQAAAITAHLPAGIERVGVFAEASLPEIVHTVQRATLTAVQLHLPHNPEFNGRLHDVLGKDVRLIQVVGVPAELSGDETSSAALTVALQRAFADPSHWAVLLDTVKNGSSGGLGVPFSWKASRSSIEAAQTASQAAVVGSEPAESRQAVARSRSHAQPKLILAGGLNASNVVEAVTDLSPWGVDCVSGVEKVPGQKDPDRLRDFFAVTRALG